MLSDCLGRPDCNITPSRPEFYNGQCAIVAVNVHFGYNQEDSLVMNRASAERGMFRSEHIRSYQADIYNEEAFSKPQKVEDSMKFGKIQSRVGRVDSLEEDGFPYIGASLRAGDIVIGKHAESGADQTLKLKHTERGTVQRVVLSANDEGKNFGIVSLRQMKQIRTALAVALLLNRTLVLPPMWCRLDRLWYPHPGVLKGTMTRQPFICPLDHVLMVKSMARDLPEEFFGPQIRIREYSLFENPSMPVQVKESWLDVQLCQHGSHGCGVTNSTGPLGVLRFPKSSSEEKFKSVFSSYKNIKVIRFSSMQDAFTGFSDKTREK